MPRMTTTRPCRRTWDKPMWSSLLFVPVLEDRFVDKAAGRGASAVVLDLEASVAEHRKAEARDALPRAVGKLAGQVDVTVRINPFGIEATRDLEACVIDQVSTVHIARCETPEEVVAIDQLVSELEMERGLPAQSIALVAMLESPRAVMSAADISRASSRLTALTLGTEDYAMEMQAEPTAALLRPLCLPVVQAARASGLQPLVLPISASSYQDLSALEEAALYAKSIGSSGGFCVHPGQIDVLNQVFATSPEQLDWATRLLEAAEAATEKGLGAFKFEGKMIDRPIVERAQNLLSAQPGKS